MAATAERHDVWGARPIAVVLISNGVKCELPHPTAIAAERDDVWLPMPKPDRGPRVTAADFLEHHAKGLRPTAESP